MGIGARRRICRGGILMEEATNSGVTVAQMMAHLRNPQNLLTYMIFTAWLKFMGVAQHIPSITVG